MNVGDFPGELVADIASITPGPGKEHFSEESLARVWSWMSENCYAELTEACDDLIVADTHLVAWRLFSDDEMWAPPSAQLTTKTRPSPTASAFSSLARPWMPRTG
jgi:hypothetical protein